MRVDTEKMSCPIHQVTHYGEQHILNHPQLSFHDQCICHLGSDDEEFTGGDGGGVWAGAPGGGGGSDGSPQSKKLRRHNVVMMQARLRGLRGRRAARARAIAARVARSKIVTTEFIRHETGPLYVFLTGSDGGVGHEPTEGIISECEISRRDLVLIHNREKDTGGWDEDVVTVQHGWVKRCEMVNAVLEKYRNRQIILAGFSNGGGALVFGLFTHRIEIPHNIHAIEIICPWMVAIPAWVPDDPPSGKPRTLQGDAHFAPIQRAYEYVRGRSHPPKMLVISSPQDSGPAKSGHPIPTTRVVVNFEPFLYDSTNVTDDMNEAMRSFDRKLHEAERSAVESNGDGDGVCIVWIQQADPVGRFPFRGHSNYCGSYCGFPRKWVREVGILSGFMGIVKKSVELGWEIGKENYERALARARARIADRIAARRRPCDVCGGEMVVEDEFVYCPMCGASGLI